MRKIRTILLTVCICLLLPVTALAAQSEIGATVPEYHSVSIEAEHASALYVQGTKGESRAYSVSRFSEPEFQIQAEDGWKVSRVLLNGTEVTSQLKNGILKLEAVREDQVITIETTEIKTGQDGGTKQENTGAQPAGTGSGNGKADSSGEENKTVIRTLVAVATGDRSVTVIAALALGGGVLLLWAAWRRRKRAIL